ncbi:MAG: thioesterase domain-containing protein [Nitrospira sp.]|nr:thioesterase domain-containing protein [Nitrospira sp.]
MSKLVLAMNSTPLSALNKYLYDHIPLSEAMGVQVVEALPNRVCVTAPLAPNINHRDTVFGGSASAVAILAAWTLLYVAMRHEGLACRVVIQRNTMAYEVPITGDFQAQAELDAAGWARFLKTLRRHNKARIQVRAVLTCEQQPVGALTGEFVALAVGDKLA